MAVRVDDRERNWTMSPDKAIQIGISPNWQYMYTYINYI